MAEEELLENDDAARAVREADDDACADEDASRDDVSDAEDVEDPDADGADGEGTEESDGADESSDDGYEEVELEFDEDDIEAYIVDEDDNEIGFIMLDEDGNEVEYYYTDDDDVDEGEDEDNPYDLGITREGVAEATSDMNDIYRDGIVIARELKDALSDIQDALDFSDVLPKKKK